MMPLSPAHAQLRPVPRRANQVLAGTHTFRHNGIARSYVVRAPDGLNRNSAPVPVVLVLHGGGGNAANAEQMTGFTRLVERERILVVYPEGTSQRPRIPLLTWNASHCCGYAMKSGVDDVGFISALLDTLSATYPVDPARIYVTGMSNGAMMALRLACETTVFAAAAPVAGTQLVDCRNARPMSVLQIHGTADPRVPYNGGPGQGFSLRGARVDGPTIPSVNAFWRTTDHCRPPTTTTRTPVTTSTARCPDGKAVQLISIAGAGHQWPGSAAHPVLERTLGADPPSTALHATQVIWQFFATR